MRVVWAARTVHVELKHQATQLGGALRRDLGRDSLVVVLGRQGAVALVQPQDEVDVRKASLLELGHGYMAGVAAKDVELSDQGQQAFVLELEDAAEEVGTIPGVLAWKERVDNLFPLGVACEGDEEGRAPELLANCHTLRVLGVHVARTSDESVIEQDTSADALTSLLTIVHGVDKTAVIGAAELGLVEAQPLQVEVLHFDVAVDCPLPKEPSATMDVVGLSRPKEKVEDRYSAALTHF